MARKFLAFLAALFCVGLVASPGFAATQTDNKIFRDAADGLLVHPVYMAPDANNDSITTDDLRKLEQEIKGYGIPVYVAVLPERAIQALDGDVDALPVAVGTALGRQGVYAVVAGHNFRANANGTLPSGETADLANQAFQNNYPPDNDGSSYPAVADFIKHVDYAINPGDKPKTNWGLIGIITGSIVGGILGIALLIWGLTVWGRRRREKREADEAAAAAQRDFQERKDKVEAMFNRVQDAVLGMTPGTDAKVKSCHDDAVNAVARARNLLDQSTTQADLQNLSSANEELTTAANSVADAKAYAEGRDPVAERKAAEAEARRLAAEETERQRVAAQKRREEERERKKLAATVKPANFKPAKSKSAANPHHYSGGYYNNHYYAPGYYSNPFWTWVVMESVLDHQERTAPPPEPSHHSDDSYSSSSHRSSSGYDSDSGGGSWGGGGGGGFDSSSGGGSW